MMEKLEDMTPSEKPKCTTANTYPGVELRHRAGKQQQGESPSNHDNDDARADRGSSTIIRHPM